MFEYRRLHQAANRATKMFNLRLLIHGYAHPRTQLASRRMVRIIRMMHELNRQMV